MAQLAAIEGVTQQVQPGIDPVAGREALRPKAITVGGEDGVAEGRGRVLEVTGGRDVGESDEPAREDLGVGGEAVEEARGVDQSIACERRSQRGGQPVLGQRGSPPKRTHHSTITSALPRADEGVAGRAGPGECALGVKRLDSGVRERNQDP